MKRGCVGRNGQRKRRRLEGLEKEVVSAMVNGNGE